MYIDLNRESGKCTLTCTERQESVHWPKQRDRKVYIDLNRKTGKCTLTQIETGKCTLTWTERQESVHWLEQRDRKVYIDLNRGWKLYTNVNNGIRKCTLNSGIYKVTYGVWSFCTNKTKLKQYISVPQSHLPCFKQNMKTG